MYKIFVDNTLVYNDETPELEELKLFSPKLSASINSAGTFSATFPTGNAGYDLIDPLKSIVDIYRDDTWIWSGRPLSVSTDFYNQKKVECEGALAFLNDIIVPMANLTDKQVNQAVTSIIEAYNAKADSKHQFKVGTIATSTDGGAPITRTPEFITNDRSAMDCISELLDIWGLYPRVRRIEAATPYYTLDMINASAFTLATQRIDFGQNLMDYTSEYDWSEIVTAIIPFGTTLDTHIASGDDRYPDKLDISSVNRGSRYLENTTAIQTHGRVEKTVEWSEIDDAETLKELGELYLEDLQYSDMVLTVTAADLHYIDSSIQAFWLYTKINCVSAPHGLNKTFAVTKIDIPFDQPENTQFTFEHASSGNYGASSGGSVKTTSLSGNLAQIPKISDFRREARANATALIESATQGYVTMVQDAEGDHVEYMAISNNETLDTSTQRWVWNVNGLMHQSRNSIDEEWSDANLAMTMEGEIVADTITTGVIRGGDNFWNLDTGEFHMAWTSEVTDSFGNLITMGDIVADAQTGANKRFGATNLLNGTMKLDPAVTSGDWNENSWAVSGNVTVKDMETPNNNLTRGYQVVNKWTIRQDNVPVIVGETYVLSIYAKGSGNLSMGIGKASADQITTTSVPDGVTSDWNRYYCRIQVESSMVENGTTSVRFTGDGTQDIAGMKLERGTATTDWSPSPTDDEAMAAEYANEALELASEDSTRKAEEAVDLAAAYAEQVAEKEGTNVQALVNKRMDIIAESSKEYTDAQKRALDAELTQKKIFDRLTNNGQRKGIYLQNGELYMNATYIQSGVINAGIIRAGILSDNCGRNFWNLATGYIHNKNATFENCEVMGWLSSGTGNQVQFNEGTVRFFNGSRNTMTIDGALYFSDGNYGAHITFSKYLVLRGPTLATSRYTTSNGVTGFTGTVLMQGITHNMAYDMSGCKLDGFIEMEFINGLFTGVVQCSTPMVRISRGRTYTE